MTRFNLLISIDDTDNHDSPGTGELAAEIADRIRARGWGQTGIVTRHQLFVHPDIPYTSHNSAMCFSAALNGDYRADLIEMAGAYLASTSAPGSDPGLCVVDVDRLSDPAALIEFGLRAKCEVLSMLTARSLAEVLDVHLSEHGGSGDGVIGALAGAGLRLSGRDGRMRGTLAIDPALDRLPLHVLQAMAEVDEIRPEGGARLAAETPVALGRKVKTVWLDGCSVLLLKQDEAGGWRTCSNQELKTY